MKIADSLIPDDARSCYYCGQKVNIKHSPTDNKQVPRQDISAKSTSGTENNSPGSTFARDAVEGKNPLLSPAPQTNPASSTKSPNPVLLAVLVIAVISALVLGGVIAVYAVTHHSSTVTPTPVVRATVTPSPTLSPTPSPTATPSPTPSPAPIPLPTLTVSPTQFNANTDCSYGANHGWMCFATLKNKSTQGDLKWSESSTGVNGISLSPPSDTLTPGQTERVTIFVPDTVCPTGATLTFKGSAEPVTEQWNCAAPTLTVSPTSLGVQACKSLGGNYQCTVTLSDDQGGANWIASSDIKGVTFTPASDTVYPSGETVTITVGCSPSGTFIFKGPGNNATVSWGCIL